MGERRGQGRMGELVGRQRPASLLPSASRASHGGLYRWLGYATGMALGGFSRACVMHCGGQGE